MFLWESAFTRSTLRFHCEGPPTPPHSQAPQGLDKDVHYQPLTTCVSTSKSFPLPCLSFQIHKMKCYMPTSKVFWGKTPQGVQSTAPHCLEDKIQTPRYYMGHSRSTPCLSPHSPLHHSIMLFKFTSDTSVLWEHAAPSAYNALSQFLNSYSPFKSQSRCQLLPHKLG